MIIQIEDFIAGWIAGICGLIVGHPLDTIKVRQQAYGSSLRTAIGRTYRHEGFRGYFKGMLFPLLTVGPSNALMFGVFGTTLAYLQPTPSGHPKHSSFHKDAGKTNIFLAGVVGGTAQTIFICPVEVVKTVLQARTEGKGSWRKHYEVPYRGTFDALRGIVRDIGFTGLFRGLAPLMIRDIPTSGLYVLTYDMLMYSKFQSYDIPHFAREIFAGGSAGIASWLFVMPVDVVKTRIQSDDPRHPYYNGIIDCFKKSYKMDGFSIFFRGAPATLMRTFPVNAAIFVTYQKVLSWFEVHY
ncbi:solute carrier family 25 member 45-like isoform X2 [Zophobas morio]|uniref:solute carrier family 25 member 45-like isoform X2 n=1 Tax=Zophobas morio TaxID=2755281 RepID=UPI0030829C24